MFEDTWLGKVSWGFSEEMTLELRQSDKSEAANQRSGTEFSKEREKQMWKYWFGKELDEVRESRGMKLRSEEWSEQITEGKAGLASLKIL